MAPRLVRRAPLKERVKAYLDPMDWLMWASEELNSSDWDEFARAYALPMGVAMNLLFMIARANTGDTGSVKADDIFGEPSTRSSGWLKWLVSIPHPLFPDFYLL